MFNCSIRISIKMRQCSSSISGSREINNHNCDNYGDINGNYGDINGCLATNNKNNFKGNDNKNRLTFNRWVNYFNNNSQRDNNSNKYNYGPYL